MFATMNRGIKIIKIIESQLSAAYHLWAIDDIEGTCLALEQIADDCETLAKQSRQGKKELLMSKRHQRATARAPSLGEGGGVGRRAKEKEG